jgi:hypothetical protein
MFKRLMLVLVLGVTLSACGGGAVPTVTPPPTATARPEPTARPTATPAPTAAPTAEPSGGAGTIPAPPDSTGYVAGEDPIVDAAITAMETQFAEQSGSGINLQELTFYVSTASADDIVAFYNEEMPSNGWGPGQTQDEEFGKVMAFIGNDFETVGLIGLLDLSTTGVSDGLIVFTTIGTPESTTGGDSATATPEASSPGGETPDDIADVPTPPGGELYLAGSDSVTDSFLEGFSSGFKQSFDGQSGLKLVGQEEFLTTATQEEIKTFYDDEMAALGWTSAAPTDNPQAQILNYTRVNGTKVEVAVVASLDRTNFGSNQSDRLVVIVVAGSE